MTGAAGLRMAVDSMRTLVPKKTVAFADDKGIAGLGETGRRTT